MKQTIWISIAATIAAGIMIAQAPPAGQAKGQTKGQGKAAPKGPPPNAAQSPASRPVPKTATPQTYTSAQIQAGEGRFAGECGFCHGRDASGGEGGPDLTRSELVTSDVRGDKIGPLLKTGRPDQGMPAFSLNDADVMAIVAYIHTQKANFEAVSGGRRAVDVADVATGNADAGRRYFAGAGGCAGCHSATGDLKGIATRFQGLALMQRMLTPTSGRPSPAPPKITFTVTGGQNGSPQNIVAPLAGEDEFSVTILDPLGARQTYQKSAVKYTISDPMSAHFVQLGKYTDTDMHNVLAYLNTLK